MVVTCLYQRHADVLGEEADEHGHGHLDDLDDRVLVDENAHEHADERGEYPHVHVEDEIDQALLVYHGRAYLEQRRLWLAHCLTWHCRCCCCCGYVLENDGTLAGKARPVDDVKEPIVGGHVHLAQIVALDNGPLDPRALCRLCTRDRLDGHSFFCRRRIGDAVFVVSVVVVVVVVTIVVVTIVVVSIIVVDLV